MNKAE